MRGDGKGLRSYFGSTKRPRRVVPPSQSDIHRKSPLANRKARIAAQDFPCKLGPKCNRNLETNGMMPAPSDREPRAPGTSGPQQEGPKPVNRRLWKVIALLIALPLLYTLSPSWFGWNQKLSMTLDTPNGPLVATTVQQVKVTYLPQWMGLGRTTGPTVKSQLKGESLALDLGDGRILLTLLNEGSLAHLVFHDLGRGRELYTAIENQIGQPPRPLRKDMWPEFVSFVDRSDPLTAFRIFAEVPPGATSDFKDISEVFGTGYRLREITLAITDEPVTTGTVERILGQEFLATLDQIHKLDEAERLKRQRSAADQLGSDSLPYISKNYFFRDFQ